jgi:acyl-CoA synthetase (AMP-forming)/AMP-acid ligase II
MEAMQKAVMVSHLNVIANVIQTCLFDAPSRRDLGVETQTNLGLLPLSHIYALSLIAHVAQYRGDEVVILPRFELASYLSAIQTYRIEQLTIVPPILIQMMNNVGACRKHDLSSVRLVYCGAAPLGIEVVDDVLKEYPSWHISQGYGNLPSSHRLSFGTDPGLAYQA